MGCNFPKRKIAGTHLTEGTLNLGCGWARRQILATLVRTKGIIYKGSDADYSVKAETPEEATKKLLDAQDYVDAKREFETDQKMLQEMKLKLLSEKIVNEPSGR